MSSTFRGPADETFDRPTEPKQPDKSLGELLGDMTNDISQLMQKEVELAKLELREEASRAGKAAGAFGGAALGGWMAVLFVSLALAWLLDQAMNTALAFLIVGVIWAIAAFVLLRSGKAAMAKVKPLPTTVQTVKEDMQWLKAQKS
jgi:uncharacterized membrane protein YqjE